MKSGLLSRIKNRLIKKGLEVRTVPTGLYKGLTFNMDLTCEMQLYLGLWEVETHSYIREAAKVCAWAVDVGAGKGELCMFLLSHSNAKIIHAFEPQQAQIKAIQDHLRLNMVGESATFMIHDQFVGCQTEKHVLAIDALGLPSHQLGFLKIDVDGAEMDVLRSGRRTIAAGRVLALVETHSKELEDQALSFFSTLGYQTRVIKNAWWRFAVPEQRPIPHNRWLWAWNESFIRP